MASKMLLTVKKNVVLLNPKILGSVFDGPIS